MTFVGNGKRIGLRDPIPPHEDPPYDRDRLLPKMDYGEPTGGEPN
jgi:hypothetical protein